MFMFFTKIKFRFLRLKKTLIFTLSKISMKLGFFFCRNKILTILFFYALNNHYSTLEKTFDIIFKNQFKRYVIKFTDII